MNILDIIIALLVIIPGIILGLKKGFVYQVVTLLTIILGAWMSFHFADAAGSYMSHYWSLDARVLKVIAFIIIFIIVYLILCLLGRMLEKLLYGLVGGAPNRILGILFAIFKLAILAGLIIVLFETLNSTFHFVSRQTLDSSVLYPLLRDFTEMIIPVIKSFMMGGKA